MAEVGERQVGGVGEGTVGPRNGVAVRVVRRVAQAGREPLGKTRRDGVLERLRLAVDLVAAVTQVLG